MATKRKTHDDSHAWLGKKIPALKVTLQNGETSALKSILNEDGWNVLYFYPRDNTPGCTQEAKDFQKSLRKFSNRAITIVGVSPDSPTSHVKFIKKLGLKFSLIADEDKALCEKMGSNLLRGGQRFSSDPLSKHRDQGRHLGCQRPSKSFLNSRFHIVDKDPSANQSF